MAWKEAGQLPAGPRGLKGDTGLPGVNAVANDTATATYATTSGSATKVALDANYDGFTAALTRDRRARKGAFAQAESTAVSATAFQDAGTLTELWASTAAWNTGGDTFPVSGGFLRGTAASNSCITKVTPIGENRYRTKLQTVAGGAEHYSWFGWSKAAIAGRGAAGDFVAVGIHFAPNGNTSIANIITWDRGVETVVATYAPGALFYMVAGQDSKRAWVELTDFTGTNSVATVSVDKATFAANQLGFFANDTRGLTGDGFGAVTGREAAVTSPVRGNELGSPASATSQLGTDMIRVMLPAGYDSRVPAPLVIYMHGWGSDSRTVLRPSPSSTTKLPDVIGALGLAPGCIVASSDAGGMWEAGSGYQKYVDLYKYVRARHAIGPVILASESFGGVAAARTLAADQIPDIAGWLAWYPVTNLAFMYQNPAFKTGIDNAYGSLAAAQAAGADPALIPTTSFRGVPFRAYHSAADTAVLKSDTDALAARLAPLTSEAVVVPTTGAHGDPSNFQAADTLAFISRCLGRA